MKEAPERSLALLSCDMKENPLVMLGTLTSDFQPAELWEINSVVYKLPSRWHFLIAAQQTKTNIHLDQKKKKNP